MAENTLSLILKFHDGQVTRQFVPLKESTRWEKAINKLKSTDSAKALSKAFQDVHKETNILNLEGIIKKEIFGKIPNIYTQEQVVPFYLSAFASVVKAEKTAGAKYRITVKACREHLFYSLERIKDGKYVLVESPFFRKAPPPALSDERSKIRGLADTIFFLAPELAEHLTDEEVLKDIIGWFRIALCLSLKEEGEDENLLRFSVTPEKPCLLASYKKKCISIPPENRPILVASPNIRDSIEKLSEAWHDPTTKSILISGWTGSGKEILVGLLADAIRIDKKQRIDLSAAAIGPSENLERIIFEGIKRNDLKEKDRIIVFLDEIHHDSAKNLREVLLRIMETGELTTEKEGTFKYEGLIWVLAASKQPEELRTSEPRDLWTRVEHTVLLIHPLRIGPDKRSDLLGNPDDICERNTILKEYFCLFWHHQAEEWTKTQQTPTAERIIGVLSDVDYVGTLSGEFVQAFMKPFVPLPSIRTVRAIAKRLFGRAITHCRMEPELQDEEVKEVISAKVREKWLVDIYKEVVSELDPRGVF